MSPQSSSPCFYHRTNTYNNAGQEGPHIYWSMSAPQLLPPNACLVSVAVIVRSRDGPRFVFHYPPRPDPNVNTHFPRFGTELDPTSCYGSGDEDELSDDSDLEDGAFQIKREFDRHSSTRNGKQKNRHVHPWDGDDHYESKDGTQIVPWEHLGEFHTRDLESILTPARAYHKRPFQLSLDPLYFISCPIHIREDGRWRKKKKEKRSKQNISDSMVFPDKIDTSTVDDESPKAESNDPEEEDDHGSMTMFNVVFIMNPPRLEATVRIHDIYEHVAKKINKALKYAQAESNYVWRESELILGLKEKGREERRPMSSLWNSILEKSSLARSIRELYIAISSNKIANIHVETSRPIDMSVQIPIATSTPHLPGPQDQSLPGLWVTTAKPLDEEDGEVQILNKHFALLLLENDEKVIADLQLDANELSGPLIQYIKLSKPTQSFAQVAQTNSIQLSDVRVLAEHLIFWRRAMAVPPLHGRDTYILSPNCDNYKLHAATQTWAKTFPLAPNLSSILATLSTQPRPYKSYPPSKDHRSTYMDMLGWLLRGGWVTQLRTFAWVVVWPEILYEVQHALDAKAIAAAKDKSESSSSDMTASMSAQPGQSTEITAENARLERLRQKAIRDAEEFSKRPLPVTTPHPSHNTAPHLTHLEPHIILDPHRADHVESLYLAAIGKRLDDERAAKAWPKFTKYLNGRDALEKIGVQEGLKRKEAWTTLMKMEEWLLSVRHW